MRRSRPPTARSFGAPCVAPAALLPSRKMTGAFSLREVDPVDGLGRRVEDERRAVGALGRSLAGRRRRSSGNVKIDASSATSAIPYSRSSAATIWRPERVDRSIAGTSARCAASSAVYAWVSSSSARRRVADDEVDARGR